MDEMMLEISQRTAICAARHIVAAHESACTGEPVEWGSPCVECSEISQCKCRWIDLMAPLFDATKIYPKLHRP